MVIARCRECGNEYELQEDEKPEDFQCECGGDLKYDENVGNNSENKTEPNTVICPKCKKENEPSSKFCAFCGAGLKSKKTYKSQLANLLTPVLAWWENRAKTGKIATVGLVCFIGLLVIVGAITQDDTKTSTNKGTPMDVTIEQLYGSSIPEGTYVRVKGEVIESDGNRIRLKEMEDDSSSDSSSYDRRDILVIGAWAYDGDYISVNGTFIGPYTYSTAIGGSRTIPAIEID